MADIRFLTHMQDLRDTYHPSPAEITPVRITMLKDSMTSIGDVIKANSKQYSCFNQYIAQHLRYICMNALDMMQCADYNKLFDDIVDLHARKNAGYAGLHATDAWANFRMSQWFDVTPFVGCLIRMSDKLIRIKNLNTNPEADQVKESITDAMYDLAIYSVIAICLLEEEVSGGGKSIMPI
jgi:hypothetical protein